MVLFYDSEQEQLSSQRLLGVQVQFTHVQFSQTRSLATNPWGFPHFEHARAVSAALGFGQDLQRPSDD
jgi:hypothetical protein